MAIATHQLPASLIRKHPRVEVTQLKEFLKNRTVRVKLGGHLSSGGIVKNCVPQGSVLRPLLSLTFINDLSILMN